jgi:hypothetical protein
MAFKVNFIVLVFVIKIVLNHSQGVEKISYDLKVIDDSIIEGVNRLISVNNEVSEKLEPILKDLETEGKYPKIVKSLQDLKSHLDAMKTISSSMIASRNTTMTCDEIALKLSSIIYDIRGCARTKYYVDVNNSMLYSKTVIVNAEFGLIKKKVNVDQKTALQAVVTKGLILVDQHHIMGKTLVFAIVKYSRLWVDLATTRDSFCKCPKQLTSAASTSFASIDKSLAECQTSVDKHEVKIRQMASSILTQISAINPTLKSNTKLSAMMSNLEKTSMYVKGFQKLTTSDIINKTTNCDDATLKVSFLRFKSDVYYQAAIEASRNSSVTITYLNLLNYHLTTNSLTETANLKSLKATLKSLSDTFHQYWVTLVQSVGKINKELYYARLSRQQSCSCNGINTAETTEADMEEAETEKSTTEQKTEMSTTSKIFNIALSQIF